MKSFTKVVSVCVLFLLLGCQKEAKIISPNHYLTQAEQEAFKYRIIRFYDKMPKKLTHDKKFSPENDSIYQLKANRSDLYYYYHDNKTSETFFAVTRIAPSIKLKKVATIGKLKIENDSIVYYEEICRTWKMEEDELKTKTAMLFEKVLNQEDLSPYLTKNSSPEFYIEFPDDVNYFDVKDRIWKVKQ